MHRVCAYSGCGKGFETHDKRQRFCGPECYYASKVRPPVTEVCQHCDREFERTRRSVPQKFCSTTCANLAKAGRANEYLAAEVGTTRYTETGYVQRKVGDVPGASRSGWMPEHRFVTQLQLGRPLREFENVHHLNGVRDDNRPENLELWVSGQPVGGRVADLVQFISENYPDEVRAALDDM